MKLDTFFDNFGLLADAPNGVQKLREMVLQLAVQGKLVPQDSKDEPASILLEQIRAEKERLIKEKKINKGKPFPLIKPDEIPYDLPNGWEWTQLATIGLINPRNEISDETKVSFVPMKLVPTVLGDRVESEIRKWGDIKKGFTHFSEGDVALAKITPCFQNRKSTVMRGLKNRSGAGTTELHIVRPINDLIISEYVLLYLKTPIFIREGVSKMTGSAGQKRVPKKYFSESPFPLPPTNEQKRIVAKVDDLMALCDELEARKQEVSINCIQLNDASVHKLLTAREPKKFNKHWQRICDNFDLLYSKPQNVTKLRQAVLQLAIQGKLVPQDPKDEPASILLERIMAEKERLIKEKKIKKTKPLPPISPDEMPYELPIGWKWVRLGTIVTFENGDRSSRYPKENDLRPSGIPFFGAKDMINGEFSFDNGLRFISEEKFSELSNGKLCDQDFVILLRGTVGKMAIFRATNKYSTGFINAQMIIIRLINKHLCNFFYCYCSSTFFQSLVAKKKTGSAVRQMPANALYDFLVPLPPLNEQKRIVAMVNQLMTLCDELEASLLKSQTDCDRLTEATVAEILAA